MVNTGFLMWNKGRLIHGGVLYTEKHGTWKDRSIGAEGVGGGVWEEKKTREQGTR